MLAAGGVLVEQFHQITQLAGYREIAENELGWDCSDKFLGGDGENLNNPLKC